YALPATDFHDITSGSNGYRARTGYDLVTGRGSPRANLVVANLVGGNAGAAAPAQGNSSTSSTAPVTSTTSTQPAKTRPTTGAPPPTPGMTTTAGTVTDGSASDAATLRVLVVVRTPDAPPAQPEQPRTAAPAALVPSAAPVASQTQLFSRPPSYVVGG